MHLPLTVVLTRRADGVHVDVFGEGMHDTTGPVDIDRLDVGQSESRNVVVSPPPEEKTGPMPPSKAMRKKARKNELKIARDIGGKAQPNSGAVPGMKGDVRKKGELRVEGKTTTSGQFIITRKLLDKIRGECGLNEKPAFVIFFANKRTLQEEDAWVLLPYEDWNATHKDL